MAAVKRDAGETPVGLWPHNIDAEIAVLGCIIDPTTPDALSIVADEVKLTARDFYRNAHELIYAAALNLRARQSPVNSLTVIDVLAQAGKLEDAGGASGVDALTTQATILAPSGDPRAYAEMVKRDSGRRQGMKHAHELVRVAHAGDFAEVRRISEQLATLADGAQTAKPRFQLLTVADMLAQPRPEPLIDGLVSLNSLGLLYGPSGVGKSVLLLDMMAHVAYGWDWHGHAVTQGPVVYVCAEGQAFMGERLQGWMLAHGVDDIPDLYILPVATQLLEPSTVADLCASITAQLPCAPVWIVFDTVSQTSEGADENDPSEMAGYIRAMGRVREATSAHVMAVHHTGKDESKGSRGASSLKGNMDTVIEIKAPSDTLAVMHCDKQRGGWAPFKDWSYRVVRQGLDEHADRTAPIIQPACAAETITLAELPENHRAALRALHGHPEGLSAGEWKRETHALGVEVERTFYRAQRALIDDGLVVKKSTGYHLTPDGLRILTSQ